MEYKLRYLGFFLVFSPIKEVRNINLKTFNECNDGEIFAYQVSTQDNEYWLIGGKTQTHIYNYFDFESRYQLYLCHLQDIAKEEEKKFRDYSNQGPIKSRDL
jgi:hypothetical protein